MTFIVEVILIIKIMHCPSTIQGTATYCFTIANTNVFICICNLKGWTSLGDLAICSIQWVLFGLIWSQVHINYRIVDVVPLLLFSRYFCVARVCLSTKHSLILFVVGTWSFQCMCFKCHNSIVVTSSGMNKWSSRIFKGLIRCPGDEA